MHVEKAVRFLKYYKCQVRWKKCGLNINVIHNLSKAERHRYNFCFYLRPIVSQTITSHNFRKTQETNTKKPADLETCQNVTVPRTVTCIPDREQHLNLSNPKQLDSVIRDGIRTRFFRRPFRLASAIKTKWHSTRFRTIVRSRNIGYVERCESARRRLSPWNRTACTIGASTSTTPCWTTRTPPTPRPAATARSCRDSRAPGTPTGCRTTEACCWRTPSSSG